VLSAADQLALKGGDLPETEVDHVAQGWGSSLQLLQCQKLGDARMIMIYTLKDC